METDDFTLKVIVFDCDGVILESVQAKAQALIGLVCSLGLDSAAVCALHGMDFSETTREEKFRRFYREYYGREITAEEYARMSELFSGKSIDAVLRSGFVPGAYEFIVAEHMNYKFYVASGAPEFELNKIFDALGISKYFCRICGAPKYKTEILNEIIAGEMVRPCQVLMVGDAMGDLRAAMSARTRFLGRGRFPPPYASLPDLTRLKEYIENNPHPE